MRPFSTGMVLMAAAFGTAIGKSSFATWVGAFGLGCAFAGGILGVLAVWNTKG